MSPPAPQVLAGLLHLGNVRFADSEDEAQPCQLVDGAQCESRGGGGLGLRLWSHTQGAGQVLPRKEPVLVGWGRRSEGGALG